MEDRLAQDPHRPLYHFLPPADWINDPNGLIQWNGRYHLFYQYNPNGPFHGTIHWGHAVSDDLVRWTDMPVALEPTPGGPDEDGCFSGCAVDHEGVPTLLYTGVRGKDQLPCLATSPDGDLVRWEKYPGNPVIAAPPPHLDLTGFRDHCVWREGEAWYQIVGAGIRDVGGAALLYRSEDMIEWEYLHPLYVGHLSDTLPVWTGSMWECPEFFRLGYEHVLMVSVYHRGELHYTAYLVGDYEDHRFTPRGVKMADHGGHFYAPQTMMDERGRRIVWGWVWEGRSTRAMQQAGWAGVLSLPRLLTPTPGGWFRADPLPELRALRGDHHGFRDLTLGPGSANPLKDVRGGCVEILAEFEPQSATKFGLKVRCSPDREEQTVIICDLELRSLGVDSRASSLDDAAHKEARWGPLGILPGEPLTLNVFVDRSVVEVSANGRSWLTERVYPTREDSLELEAFALDGSVGVKTLDVWAMEPMWSGPRS